MTYPNRPAPDDSVHVIECGPRDESLPPLPPPPPPEVIDAALARLAALHDDFGGEVDNALAGPPEMLAVLAMGVGEMATGMVTDAASAVWMHEDPAEDRRDAQAMAKHLEEVADHLTDRTLAVIRGALGALPRREAFKARVALARAWELYRRTRDPGARLTAVVSTLTTALSAVTLGTIEPSPEAVEIGEAPRCAPPPLRLRILTRFVLTAAPLVTPAAHFHAGVTTT